MRRFSCLRHTQSSIAYAVAGTLAEASSPEAAADISSEGENEQDEATSSQVAALQEQMVAAMQKVSAAEKEAAAAKEAAGTELALMRRQLTSSQAALADAEQVLGHLNSPCSTDTDCACKTLHSGIVTVSG